MPITAANESVLAAHQHRVQSQLPRESTTTRGTMQKARTPRKWLTPRTEGYSPVRIQRPGIPHHIHNKIINRKATAQTDIRRKRLRRNTPRKHLVNSHLGLLCGVRYYTPGQPGPHKVYPPPRRARLYTRPFLSPPGGRATGRPRGRDTETPGGRERPRPGAPRPGAPRPGETPELGP